MHMRAICSKGYILRNPGCIGNHSNFYMLRASVSEISDVLYDGSRRVLNGLKASHRNTPNRSQEIFAPCNGFWDRGAGKAFEVDAPAAHGGVLFQRPCLLRTNSGYNGFES